MNRKTHLTRREMIALTLSAGAATAAASPNSPPPRRPNILLLMADQHRGDCVGADGNGAIATPHLDSLASEGALFRHAYSCTPTCTPARSALLTGLQPWNHGMLGYGRVGERYPLELPRALAEAGYATAGIGKMHCHPQRNGHGFERLVLDESKRVEEPGFESDYLTWFKQQAPGADPFATGLSFNGYRSKSYAHPEELHPTRWTADRAVEFLDGYSGPRPFFLKVSFARPHSPYDPPKRFFERYAAADLPAALVGKWAARYAPGNPANEDSWHGDFRPEQVRRSRQGYYGSVSFVDEQIGRILEALRRRGWLDNTIILYTSDHGDMTGDHHLWRKSYPYESSARIPMLVRWPTALAPSASRGQFSTAPVELRDVLPTCLEAAGIPVSRPIDGQSLLALVRDKQAKWRPWIDLEHGLCYDKSNHWNALTDGRRKYIFNAFDGHEEFFDLENDPHELNDLASDPKHKSELAEWRSRLVEHLKERGEKFVKDGKLALRPGNDVYGPNHPGCSCHPQPKKT
jgi:arylsulfatase A-like enzyme